jgi:(p)ppGpp synthase/HD superfamily hydrolase
MVHREDCHNLSHVNPERKIAISWEAEASAKPLHHSVRLEVHAIDRVGVLKDILSKIAEANTNVTNAKVKILPDQTAVIDLTVDIADLSHLEALRKSIHKVPDVVSVTRQTGTALGQLPGAKAP